MTELSGDAQTLLSSVGIAPTDVGRQDSLVPLSQVAVAIELAATVTSTPDFGRRLAERQGIEILGMVGAAARTAASAAEALAVFEEFLAAYTPGLVVRLRDTEQPDRVFFALEFVDRDLPPLKQSIELTLGVTLRALKILMGVGFRPLSVHLPHEPLAPVWEYRLYYSCTPVFAQTATGFTLARADLDQPLHQDRLVHETIVQFLRTVTSRDDSTCRSVEAVVGQLLSSGTVRLETIAGHLNLHPKALQRRLAAEGTTFAEIVDGIRRRRAEQLLCGTGTTLSQLARELGYAEQSVLTRACRRWFGCGPSTLRKKRQI